MSTPLKHIYRQFLDKSRLFASVDEILHFKGKWPLRTWVKDSIDVDGVLNTPNRYYVGLDISSKSTGLCILNNHCGI